MYRFRDEYHPQVKKDLKKINKSVQLEIKDLHIPKILNDPYIADELTGDLAGIRSYHLKQDRVPEQIVFGDQTVLVAQSRRGNGLLRGPFEDAKEGRKVLTVYRTSKVEKYWKEQ